MIVFQFGHREALNTLFIIFIFVSQSPLIPLPSSITSPPPLCVLGMFWGSGILKLINIFPRHLLLSVRGKRETGWGTIRRSLYTPARGRGSKGLPWTTSRSCTGGTYYEVYTPLHGQGTCDQEGEVLWGNLGQQAGRVQREHTAEFIHPYEGKVLATQRFKGNTRDDKQVIYRVFRRRQNNP